MASRSSLISQIIASFPKLTTAQLEKIYNAVSKSIEKKEATTSETIIPVVSRNSETGSEDEDEEFTEWETALETCDEILSDCDDIPENGKDFAESVREKVENIKEWIVNNGAVTDNQLNALENMKYGVERWLN